MFWVFFRPAADIVLLLQNVQCKVNITKGDGDRTHNPRDVLRRVLSEIYCPI